MFDRLDPPRLPGPARVLPLVVGLIFAGIGVTVLVFLWAQPLGEFGSPPLLFRLVGSFIALAFITIGGGTAYAVLTGQELGRPPWGPRGEGGHESSRPPGPGETRYVCPHCGAPLAESAEVSPLGDVKCGYCAAWFNVHGKS